MTFPVHPDELTSEWLTEALHASGAVRHAEVVAFDTRPMSAEKGMTGFLTRLHLCYDQPESTAPASVVAKFSGLDPGLRQAVHSMGFYEREVRFYQQLASSTPVRTPNCYFADIDGAEGSSLILLEDLAPARNGSWVAGSSLQDVQLALTEIAKVHAAWWQSPMLEENTWLRMTGFLSVEQVQTVFKQTWQPFLNKLTVPISSLITEVGQLLQQHLQQVDAYLFQAPPRTLIHYDYDADNLFFTQRNHEPTLTVIDWQLTTGGHAPVDVAWLIAGQCETQLRRDNEHHLLRLYHSRLVERGVPDYTFEQCWDDYRLALLLPAFRIAAAVGMSPTPPGLHGGFWDVVYPRYCQAIHDLNVNELLHDGNWQHCLPAATAGAT